MADDPAARLSPVMLRFFGRVMARAMRRGFHAVRLARPGWPELPAGRPAIVYLNHPSWWDAAFGIVMTTTRFAERPCFAPIDAAMLRRYRFMGRIGLFGVEPGTAAGGTVFLRTAMRLLRDPRAMLWITAQGAMTDPRARPLALRPGLAHLARRVPDAVLVPLALEYPFWDERTPEALARFGTPFDAATLTDATAQEAGDLLARPLEAAMDALAEDALSRDPARFTRLIEGRVGVGGVYDAWRRARALAGGHGFQAAHGDPER